EGCGNTIRNVTGDPWAGVAEDEPFDITPYAAAYARYFVRHPTTQLMPRKVKTAFSASEDDRAITKIHDVGFISKVKEIDGEEVRGVEIKIGGGTSIQPRLAPTLYDFVELDNGDYLKVTEAALRIFDRQDWLQQNLVLRWIRDESVYDVWLRLTELGLGETGAFQVTDVVSCPGTDSCKLGITSSMGLNRAIQGRIEEMQITDPLTKQIDIKMSG